MKYILNGNISDLIINLNNEHIKTANTISLRILLLVIKENMCEFSSLLISGYFNITTEEADEAIGFWVSFNIFKRYFNETKKVEPSKTETFKYYTENQNINNILEKEKNYSDIAFEKTEFKDFFCEVEQIIGRLISGLDISVILNLHKKFGMPKEVIFMLIEWCAQNGRTTARYIEKVGQEWVKEGILTIKAFEEKMFELSNNAKLWARCRKLFGIPQRAPTKKEQECMKRWVDEFKFSDQIIKEAYDCCINLNGKYITLYIDKTLTNWYKAGIDTIDKLKEFNNNKPRKNKQRIYETLSNSASYNLEDYEKITI